jgi:4-amino-4-deoxy-L-arabinose transferase-like glycosyltransferase
LVLVGAPVSGHHAWRQADTAAMARNFHDHGMRLLQPQVDWGGASPGYVESEFPIYSYVVAILYRLFGVWDGWGRVVSALCGVATVAALYELVRRRVDERAAWWAALFYAIAPLEVFFGRAVMPEAAMLLCSVLAVLWFARWMATSDVRHGILAAAATAMAALLKLPALYLGLPLLFLAWERHGRSTWKRIELWIFALAVLVPVAAWYVHAHELYRQTGLTFGIWGAGADKWGSIGPLATWKFYNDVFFKSIAERHLTWAGFALCIAGLALPRRREERVFIAWLVGLLAYVGIVTTGNQVHDYYQLPFALPAAAFIGKAMAWAVGHRRSRRRVAVLLLGCAVLVPILSGLRLQSLWRKESHDSTLARLASAARAALEPGTLAVVVDRGDPVWMYRCEVRGWHAAPESLTTEFLHDRAGQGARYLLGPTAHFDGDARRLDALIAAHEPVAVHAEWFIFRLAPR